MLCVAVNVFMGLFILFATYGVWQAARSGQAASHPMFMHYNRGTQAAHSHSHHTHAPTLAAAPVGKKAAGAGFSGVAV